MVNWTLKPRDPALGTPRSKLLTQGLSLTDPTVTATKGVVGDMASPPVEPSNTAAVIPSGYTPVYLDTLQKIINATRGVSPYNTDPLNTCYVIRNGTYTYWPGGTGTSPLMWFRRGGIDAVQRRYFIGETRQGVIIEGRNAFEGLYSPSSAGYLTIQNMSFDISGLSSNSYSTIDINVGWTDVAIKDCSFTGDEEHGAKGAHISVVEGDEAYGSGYILIDNCLLEKFGRSGTEPGHEDHGFYIASGHDITIQNCIIRSNSSRGIQVYTAGEAWRAVTDLTIRNNWIYGNGHSGDSEDGILFSCEYDGSLTGCLVERNFIYDNWSSGLRYAGAETYDVVVQYNTFYNNNVNGTQVGEINTGDNTWGYRSHFHNNIFVPTTGSHLFMECNVQHDFIVDDNVCYGTVALNPQWVDCVSNVLNIDPQFVDASGRNFHTQNPAVASYGVYGV